MMKTARKHQQVAKAWPSLVFSVTLFAVLLVTPALKSFAAVNNKSYSLTVSAAISLKDALDRLGPVYEREHPGTKVTFNYGGSGTLLHQIEQGAPVDVFFSAAEKQMDQLESQGLILPGTRADIVGNSLVLIAPSYETSLHDFSELTSPGIRHVALGKPSTVPAGEYAKETLVHFGLFGAIEKKIVYAKDVRAVLAYVETGNAGAGFVYRTDALTSSKVRIAATAPSDAHDPIVYPAAVVRGTRNPGEARTFVAFLKGTEAQTVFETFGFQSAENQPKKN